MVNNSKILTVSYGTFSCTLEGFDDSFGTMKAIAEYFRDLAADDRYFGAEPPAPDAEMLARIAEREIARRVEAHREDNTFVLRAESQGADTADADMAGEDVSPQGHEHPVAADTAANETVHARVSEEADAAETAADIAAAPETVEPQTPAPAETTPEALAEQTDSESADSQPSSQNDDDTAAQRGDDEPLDPGAAEASVEESPAEHAEDTEGDDLADDLAEPAPAASPEFEADSVAAKLQRIREVVSRNETASTGGDYTEDEHANDVLSDEEAATEDFLTGAQDDIAAALAADDEVEAAQVHDEDSAVQGEAEAKTDGEEDPVFEAEAEADTEDEDDISSLLDRLSASDAAGETDPANDTPKAESVFDDLEYAPDAAAEARSEGEGEGEDSAPVRARVIKMKKADFDAAVAEGQLEEDLGDDEGASAASSLSPDEEDELMRELAAVEAELAEGDAQDSALADEAEEEDGEDTVNLFSDEDMDDADAVIASTLRSERSAQLSESGADAEMGRILDETNTKLEENEGRGRRSAIAHLRAAVKATKAERDMGGDLGASGRDTEAYREDLETAVRPRRPMKNTQTERPRHAAPLKLVAEQRIDTPKPGAPVKPRRVSVSRTTDASAVTDGESFADYVETVGAHNLSEVLEAAASYMAFIEGQDAFSRPQLMQKLGETEHAQTSREDRLRSFGQLLRAGKIRKIGGGRFEAAEDISYRPAS